MFNNFHAKTVSTTMEGGKTGSLHYSLVSEPGRASVAVYGIEVELKAECGQTITTKATDAFTNDLSFAKQILEFVAEHKVGPIIIEDVIEDNCDDLRVAYEQQSAILQA